MKTTPLSSLILAKVHSSIYCIVDIVTCSSFIYFPLLNWRYKLFDESYSEVVYVKVFRSVTMTTATGRCEICEGLLALFAVWKFRAALLALLYVYANSNFPSVNEIIPSCHLFSSGESLMSKLFVYLCKSYANWSCKVYSSEKSIKSYTGRPLTI